MVALSYLEFIINIKTNHPISNTMKTIKFISVIATVILFLTSCSVYKIASDKDSTIDFSKYKTFAWYAKNPQSFKNSQFDNQIIESNIKNYVSAELKKRGMTVNVDNPDVLLDYSLMIENKTEQAQNPIYSHPYNYGYYNPYRPMANQYIYSSTIIGYKTTNVPYKEGTLTISMVDKSNNRVVWRGWSEGTLTDAQSYESDLHNDIHKILKKYPLKALKQNKVATTKP